jgi:hypothetical protein
MRYWTNLLYLVYFTILLVGYSSGVFVLRSQLVWSHPKVTPQSPRFPEATSTPGWNDMEG